MDLLCFFSVLCLLCLCGHMFICALRSSFVVSTVSLSLSHCYHGSAAVLGCIDI